MRIETPAVVIDGPVAMHNIAAAQARFDALGIALRPHIKTHKLVRFALMQLAAGAAGITCQKTSEAEPFAAAGCDDILITFNIIGEEKIARLKGLMQKARVTAVADSAEVVAGLSQAFADAPGPLGLFVECDTGHGRCGVQSPAAAAELAGLIARSPGLTFAGLMTYPAAGSPAAAEAFLGEARRLSRNAAGSCPVITSGGTPSMKAIAAGSVITEYRPGTYIYNDRSLVARGACELDDCALTVAATVVSRPTGDRAILDAGSKALSSDLLGLSGYGLIREYPDAVIAGLSEEHGNVDVSRCRRKPEVGEVVRIVPNHACVVTNLFDTVHIVDADGAIDPVRVDARGAVR